ncbi:MAG TPA: hypothetical protein VGK69_09040 [Gaiellaceae bacterium]
MSRKKTMQSIREAKDRRAKRLAIGGGIVLVLLLAWEVPHFLSGKKSAAPAPATTSAVAPTGSTTPGTTTTTATATPGATPVAATPTASTKLTNSDLPPSQSKEQLSSFSTFASKDPFDQQVTADSGLAGSGTGTSSASPPASSAPPASSGPVVTSSRTLARTGAVTIVVNGKRESVRVGASFPSSNPTFRLVSLSAAGARIGIANGSYSSGAQTVLLRLNRTVTLVDSTNGVRYKLQLALGS